MTNRIRTAATLAIPVLALAALSGCGSDPTEPGPTNDPAAQAVALIEGYAVHHDEESAAEYLGQYLRGGSRAESKSEDGLALAEINVFGGDFDRTYLGMSCTVTNADDIAPAAFKSRTAGDFYLVEDISLTCGEDGEYFGEGSAEFQLADGEDDMYVLDDLRYFFDPESEKVSLD